MADAGSPANPALDERSLLIERSVSADAGVGAFVEEHKAALHSASPSRLPLRGLGAVDELLRAPSASGVILVSGPRATLEAVGAHAARRALSVSRTCLRVGLAGWDEAWRELAAQLGIAGAPDPSVFASRICEALGSALLVVSELGEGTPTVWGQTVAEEVSRLVSTSSRSSLRGPLVLLLRVEPVALSGGRTVHMDPVASADETKLFWEAIAASAEASAGPEEGRLAALERWWSLARRLPLDGRPETIALDDRERRFVARLSLARRSFPVASVGLLEGNAVVDSLVRRGVVVVDALGAMLISSAVPIELEVDREDAAVVASALLTLFAADPWAQARASELWARAGRPDLSEEAAKRALLSVSEPLARVDFWQRWQATIALFPEELTTPVFLRSAELALAVGDTERAMSFAKAASVRDASAPEVMLTLGKALSAEGDLTTSTIVLQRAMEATGRTKSQQACVAVELAEVRYTAGDLEAARGFAEDALASAPDLATRLRARNVIGKLLLASASWSAAESHFAADAWEAGCGGEVLAELRARLNRAIAVLSAGRLDEARPMLSAVLEDGAARGEYRAVGFALTNLATIAILRRDYLEAFQLSERAIDVFRRIRERLFLATVIPNLAELRLDLGLVAEAEQTLAFGQKACGPALPGTRAPHFSLVAARIHLARGRSQEARAELSSAIAGASGSSNGAKLCECYCLAARIALHDGSVARAVVAIERARTNASSTLARAEVAVLDAMRARAAGERFEVLADEALELAREADAPELERDALVLLHQAAFALGDLRSAEAYLAAAIAVRDRVADALPAVIRERYLARPELVALATMEARVVRPREHAPRACERCGDAACAGCSAPSMRSPAPSPLRAVASASARIVGRDASVLSLLSAIRKVAPSDTTVLVLGESGSGKELVADAIHENSPRRVGPLVKVNCSALVETLLLSELFGHEKGAFTGALARRRGRFELAEGGTIFLDEIGDISPRTQVALLRVLEDRTFERVGGVAPMRANVRIVCATHRDLRAMVGRGEFREDLYYRLRQVVLEVPALRQRVSDLPLLVSTLLTRIGEERAEAPKRISENALSVLARYAWPGNVRELENALRAAALFAESEMLELEDFTTNVALLRGLDVAAAPSISPSNAPSGPSGPSGPGLSASNAGEAADGATPALATYTQVRSGVSLSDMKRQIERECIARALDESGGNITRAAVLLGMKRPRLSQLVKQYGLGSTSEDGT